MQQKLMKNYSNNEEEIIKQTLLKLVLQMKNLKKIINDGKKIEKILIKS